MKKVKKVRKSGENMERSESLFWFLLCSGFYPVHFRKCAPLQDSRGQNRQRPKKGVADVRGYNTMGQVGGFPLVSRL